jgi:hypothetical protein
MAFVRSGAFQHGVALETAITRQKSIQICLCADLQNSVATSAAIYPEGSAELSPGFHRPGTIQKTGSPEGA